MHRAAPRLLWLLLLFAIPGSAELRVLAVSDAPVPGLPGARYDAFPFPPLVDEQGRVAFTARLRGDVGSVGRQATFIADTSRVLDLALTGTGDAEGLPAGWMRFDTVLQGFTGGHLLATATIGSTPSGTPALLIQRPLVPIELLTDNTPLGSGFVVQEFRQPLLTANGLVGFRAFLQGIPFPSNNGALVGPDGMGGLALFAQLQQPPPDAGLPGTLLSRMGQARMNRAGEVAFPGAASLGFFLMIPGLYGPAPDGHLTRIVSLNDPAPGALAGATFENFGEVQLTNAGDVFFRADCTGGEGVWQRTRAGALQPVVATCGAFMPLPGGGELFRVGDSVAANDEGTVAFDADVTPSPAFGFSVWRAPAADDLERLIAPGDPMPDRPALSLTHPGLLDMNQRGDVLLRAGSSEPVTSGTFHALLLAAAGEPEPRLLALAGDRLEVAPGDRREISAFSVAQDRHGSRRPLSEEGTVAFVVFFSDFSQAIVAARVPIMGDDRDEDGVLDVVDNCLEVPNPDQADTDRNGRGDACNDAQDPDGDEIEGEADNCPFDANLDQADTDEDGIGDACNQSIDRDGDEIRDDQDNCPDVPNVFQIESDGDGLGNACDPFPLEPDNEKGQLRADLATTTEILLECLERPVFVDLDGDGEADDRDACAETPPGSFVDSAGCSQAQFCERLNALDRSVFECLLADWLGNEALRIFPRDCTLEWGRGFGASCVLGEPDVRVVEVPDREFPGASRR